MTLKKTVVLVGMMGAGKTSVGKALAEKLDVPFRDSDEEISIAANRSIAEIFQQDGEAFFRQKETQILARLLDQPPAILSTGGGIFQSLENRRLISEKAVSLWLRVDLALLWERVRHRDTRPLLRTPDPYKTLSEIYEIRVPIYSQADLSIHAMKGDTIHATALKVINTLYQRLDVLAIP